MCFVFVGFSSICVNLTYCSSNEKKDKAKKKKEEKEKQSDRRKNGTRKRRNTQYIKCRRGIHNNILVRNINKIKTKTQNNRITYWPTEVTKRTSTTPKNTTKIATYLIKREIEEEKKEKDLKTTEAAVTTVSPPPSSPRTTTTTTKKQSI